MEKPRIAILGASGFGKFHAREFRDAGCDICAILGSSKESSLKTSEMLLKEYKIIASPYYKLEELIKRERLNAVSICLPWDFHEKYTRKCLESGRHVLCEKPFVVSKNGEDYRTAKELFELAKEKNRVLTVNTQWPSVLKYLGGFGEKIEKFYMTMEPGLKGREMIIDSIPHMNSMLIRLIPNGEIKNLEFSELKEDCAKIKFDYIHSKGLCRVKYNMRSKKERPREVSFSINEDTFKRETGENYQQKIIEGGRVFDIEDPVKVSIRSFVSALNGGKTLINREEVLENVKMQDEILKEYLNAKKI